MSDVVVILRIEQVLAGLGQGMPRDISTVLDSGEPMALVILPIGRDPSRPVRSRKLKVFGDSYCRQMGKHGYKEFE